MCGSLPSPAITMWPSGLRQTGSWTWQPDKCPGGDFGDRRSTCHPPLRCGCVATVCEPSLSKRNDRPAGSVLPGAMAWRTRSVCRDAGHDRPKEPPAVHTDCHSARLSGHWHWHGNGGSNRCDLHRQEGLRINVTSIHPALIAHCRNSPDWRCVGIKKQGSTPALRFRNGYRGSLGRAVASFEFEGN